MRIEPGLAPDGHGRWEPVHDYYVVFWRQPRIPESELPPGAMQEVIMWSADEQYVRQAGDVHEVISWADEEARRRRATYTLYAVIRRETARVSSG